MSDEMAEFVVQLRKEIKDKLTRQGMQNIRGLYRESLTNAGGGEKYLSESEFPNLREKHTNKVLRVKVLFLQSMHLTLHRSTSTFVTMSIRGMQRGNAVSIQGLPSEYIPALPKRSLLL